MTAPQDIAANTAKKRASGGTDFCCDEEPKARDESTAELARGMNEATTREHT